MKHPVRDRLVILLFALVTLCIATVVVALLLGRITVDPMVVLLGRISNMTIKTKVALIGVAVVLVLATLRLIAMVLPAKKAHSSNFAVQQNENGTVSIAVKALDALVQRCLKQHPEIRVVSSSLRSDGTSVRIEVHVALQSDISMPLAISSLQKQIKRYLEACSGVSVEEVCVVVEGAIPASEGTVESPFAIPASMLGQEQLVGTQENEPLLVDVDEIPSGVTAVEEMATEPSEVDATEEEATEGKEVVEANDAGEQEV